MKEIKSYKKNLLKKIFVKLCRILGFEIVDQSNFSVPTSKKSLDQIISQPGKDSVTFPLGQIKHLFILSCAAAFTPASSR